MTTDTPCARWRCCWATRTRSCAACCRRWPTPSTPKRRCRRRAAPNCAPSSREMERADPIELEARYVELFDRGRATSLHLFEHVHGDSRDRGPAMIDLTQTYEKAGLLLGPHELPDHLCVVLEFASTQPPRAGARFPRRDGPHPQRDLQRAAQAREPLCQRARRRAGTGRPQGRGRARGRRRADRRELGRAGGVRRLQHPRPGRSRPAATDPHRPQDPSRRQEHAHELPEPIPVRLLPVHLPRGLPAGQPDPVRPRPVHLEERFVAVAAPRPVALGQQPVPHRHPVPARGHTAPAC